MENLVLQSNLFLWVPRVTIFFPPETLSLESMHTERQSKLLKPRCHGTEVPCASFLTHVCSCPQLHHLIVGAYFVLLNWPPVSFSPVFSDDDDDDESFIEYLLFARHCLTVETQLLHYPQNKVGADQEIRG